ncbi:hypothetical protein DSC45_04860 [Streptomyces sp. YIM 130001]|uniref:hypothetical protein n=1 Tax=Streptomyces sp. YIM 130001 TaxID=2259644 RepID=UPI000E657FCC|nr:hypothetical protein [Streptomyces sp. YIM 130001]RII20538.1 hypothetical protein DSC45_04860 [Streptomyces sp. YIM 130001]
MRGDLFDTPAVVVAHDSHAPVDDRAMSPSSAGHSTELPLADFPHFNECLSEQSAMAALGRFRAPPGPSAVVVTEINPDRDPDGTLIGRLVDGRVSALAA